MKKIRDMAVAIKYDATEDSAPKVVAVGAGEIAERIKAIAEEKNIPLHQDTQLVEKLGMMEIGDEIPYEAYEIMAEIIAWVYSIKK